MLDRFEGQCQCGEVTYEVHGIAATAFACHCTDCQKQSASAFGMALWVLNSNLVKLDGETKLWTRTMPSGKQMECTSCSNCGSRLFHKVLGQSQILSIKVGSLVRAREVQPVAHIWTSSKQDWVTIPSDVLQYQKNPESYEPLFERWKSKSG